MPKIGALDKSSNSSLEEKLSFKNQPLSWKLIYFFLKGLDIVDRKLLGSKSLKQLANCESKLRTQTCLDIDFRFYRVYQTMLKMLQV